MDTLPPAAMTNVRVDLAGIVLIVITNGETSKSLHPSSNSRIGNRAKVRSYAMRMKIKAAVN